MKKLVTIMLVVFSTGCAMKGSYSEVAISEMTDYELCMNIGESVVWQKSESVSNIMQEMDRRYNAGINVVTVEQCRGMAQTSTMAAQQGRAHAQSAANAFINSNQTLTIY